MVVKLNLGCGGQAMGGFINHDIAQDGVDLCDLGIYEDESVDEVQCRHALEHVGRDEVVPALREWHRVLKVGGKVLVSCPDIIACMNKFLGYKDENRWGNGSINETIWGDQSTQYEFHLTGFSMERLVRVLEEAGFEVTSTKNTKHDHGSPGLRVEAVKK